jgi:hypothetical protein
MLSAMDPDANDALGLSLGHHGGGRAEIIQRAAADVIQLSNRQFKLSDFTIAQLVRFRSHL